MGQCVEKLPHSCGSSGGLQVFENDGAYDGYCFACGEHVANPYSDKPEGYKPEVKPGKTDEEKREEISEIAGYGGAVDLPTRGLKRGYLDYFGVKIGVSMRDGHTPEVVYFPYISEDGEIVSYKSRLLEPKRMWNVGFPKQAIPFFGWAEAVSSGAKTLYITEGEFDAVALFQILKESNKGTAYEHFNPAVVSIQHGSASAKDIIVKNMSLIRKNFADVVLVFDTDAPGKNAVEEVVRKIPYAKVAELPEKDANECLLKGRSKACKNAVVFKASKPKNSRIVHGAEMKEQAKQRPEFGLSWPWEGLTKATRGIRRGETIYLGAGVKMGKSELVNALAAHMIKTHDLPVFMVKPEESPVKTYQRLVGKVAGKVFHDPTMDFDEQAFDEAEPLIGDKALIYDLYQFVEWDSLKDDIMYAVSTGVQDIFIDPITCLTNQLGSAEANEKLVSMSAELSAMAKDHNFTAYIFCHCKAPDSGSHERGAPIYSNQFAGSRAMMRSCNYMIGLEGNKDPDLSIEERNMRDLVILEDREYGVSERIHLYWDYETGIFYEIGK